MQQETFVLGTIIEDTITATKGMLTHLLIYEGSQREYIYQPKGLSPSTGKPVEKIILTEGRIKGGQIEKLEVPMEIMGTQAEDIATGFKGKVIRLVYHLSGCLHIVIQPPGINKESGALYDVEEFDIRRVKGEKIPLLTKKEVKESVKKTPSPMSYPRKVV